jgi:DAACS family dicarboxylate/amino acid:cation (Na+ or H+) symporter
MKILKTLTAQIILALTLGLSLGPFWVKELGLPLAPLAEMGKSIIQLIKLVAAPLLFFSILHAILSSEVRLRQGMRMIAVASTNAALALLLGLTLSNLFRPGDFMRESLKSFSENTRLAPPAAPAPPIATLDFTKTLQSLAPPSWVQPWLDNNILALVVLALLLGIALRKTKNAWELSGRGADFRPISLGVEGLTSGLEHILLWVVRLTPLAVFGAVTKAVADYGYSPLRALGFFLVLGLAGFVLHSLVVYQAWVKLVGKIPLRGFWREAKAPVIFSLGANSSLATLPLTLRALDRLGVSRSSSALGACVGTNLNNDGIILYEAMAVLFVAQVHGLDWGLATQAVAAFMCLVAAMGIAGVPEAGFVALSIILSTLGMPLEMLPLLLTIDWILARARSAVNVLSDMTVSISIDRETRVAARADPEPLPSSVI